jgi:hypothetical protein
LILFDLLWQVAPMALYLAKKSDSNCGKNVALRVEPLAVSGALPVMAIMAIMAVG